MAGPVIIAPSVRHTATLIFLHGLGDTGHGWAQSMGEIRAPYVKVICPTAPTMPVSLNAGFRMPTWFDLKGLDRNDAEDEEGIKKATGMVHGLVDAEIQSGISPNRIVVGGFSQGGALALYSSLTCPKQLGGVMALSCWLPLHKTFPGVVQGNNQDTPILQCHGDCDPVVPYNWGLMSSSILKKFARKAEFKTYHGLSHSSNDEEMEDLRSFIKKYLPVV